MIRKKIRIKLCIFAAPKGAIFKQINYFAMKIIAESSATRTEWAFVDGTTIVEHAYTSGMNPYFQTRRELSHSIRLELPETFFHKKIEHIYFYGAGCANQEKCKIMASSLIAQFRAPVTVQSDLLGAARGLWVHKPGVACIIGTGSNSCYYDGNKIVKNVPPLGYILGDEGSSAYLGKMFLADILKGIAPKDLSLDFYERHNVTSNMLLNEIYSGAMPSRGLARYGMFLSEHLDNQYVYELVYKGFKLFFERNIGAYDYKNNPVGIVGGTAMKFKKILEKAAKDYGAELAKIIPASMPGLIQFHK